MDKFEFNPAENVFRDMAENEESHWWYKSLRDFVVFNIQNLKINKVLDAGCGTGMNLLMFKNLGFSVEGFDFSEEALKYSKKRGFENLKIGNVLNIPYSDSSFDFVSCFDVLGALKKDQMKEALFELNRVLQKDGYLLIHAAAIPWMKDLHNKDWDFKSKYYLNDFYDVFDNLNLEIIRATYRVSLLFPLIFLFRFFQKKLKGTNSLEQESIKTNSTLNYVLYKIMQLENLVLRFINLPIGNSLFILARKK